MDFASLRADRDHIIDRHYTPGRGGHAIDKVVVHYMGGDLTGEQCVDNVWSTRPASAHYCVDSGGGVVQTVWDRDTAWHCGDYGQNQRSVGIEHANVGGNPGRLTDACLDAGAHLVAAVCLFYGLGRPEWGANVYGHNMISSTDCPGPIADGAAQHDEYVARCRDWYDRMAGASAPGGGEVNLNDMLTDVEGNTLSVGHCISNGHMDGADVRKALLGSYRSPIAGDDSDGSLALRIVYMDKRIRELSEVTVPAMDAAIRALAAARGADPDAVARAVSGAVSAKLATIKLTVATS